MSGPGFAQLSGSTFLIGHRSLGNFGIQAWELGYASQHAKFPDDLPQSFPEQDLPITLKDACEVVFKGAISVVSLKAEHSRGNLEITKLAEQTMSISLTVIWERLINAFTPWCFATTATLAAALR